jgi:hypothetical protein
MPNVACRPTESDVPLWGDEPNGLRHGGTSPFGADHFWYHMVAGGPTTAVLPQIPADWGICGGCNRQTRWIEYEEVFKLLAWAATWTDNLMCLADTHDALRWVLDLSQRYPHDPGTCDGTLNYELLPNRSGWFVYRLFNNRGAHCYTGRTTNLYYRAKAHARRFGDAIGVMEWEECESCSEMEEHEVTEIAECRPAWNVQGVR